MVNLIREPLPSTSDHLSDASADAHRLKAEQVAQRDAAVKELSSRQLAPETRVRLWEKIHDIRLPRSAGHPVLHVIARVTGLSLIEVETVQRERS